MSHLIGGLSSLTLSSSTSSGASSTFSKNDIESLFNKIMSPIKKEADPNLVGQFCYKLNNDFDGAQIAIDLITTKMQSNQEWEAFIALYLLEACVKNCGDRFHDLIGRFRFLNEMIKLVSPKLNLNKKYYANRTSEKVKSKCIELLYSWAEGLPQKTKIKEAYDMLKRQGIVMADPTHVEKLVINVAPRPKDPIFEDEERSKQLARLLKSKNPQDLELANRMIKNMVKQDELKTEKTSHRINELEHINNNMKLLNEMLLNYNSNTVTESEKETIRYLYEELIKLRPNLIKLATECDENDDAIGEIIKANEQSEKIVNRYRMMFDKDSSSFMKFNDDVNLVNLAHSVSTDESETKKISKQSMNDMDLIDPLSSNEPKTTSKPNYDPLKELQDLFSAPTPATAKISIDTQFSTNSNSLNTNNLIDNIDNDNNFNSILSNNNKSLPKALIPTSTQNLLNKIEPKIANNQNQIPQTPQLKALNELNVLGRSLMEKSLNDPATPLNHAVTDLSNGIQQQHHQQKLSLNEIQQMKFNNLTNNINTNTILNTNIQQRPLLEPTNQNVDIFNILNSLVVKLEDIKPGNIPPLSLYDKNNFKIILHFARDSPHPNIHVVVISGTSANSLSELKNFSFQAAVPKSMKVKLQPASRSDLPVYNPILPPTAITQVMLIANPNKEQIRLKYKLSYTYDDAVYNETEELKSLPMSVDLI